MEGYLAEIRMFGGNFAPRGWMFCQSQLLSIAQWTAVFALLGTTYGGNGQTTFGLPDFRSRVALGTGQGPGLPNVDLGEMAGVPQTTLTTLNLPLHVHPLVGATANIQVNNDNSNLVADANGKRLAASSARFTANIDELVSMAPLAVTGNTGPTGGNQPFSNLSPYCGIQFIICVEGIFPSRN